MEQTLNALAGILIKAIPTVIFLLVLHFYLKSMFFKPLEKVLKAREEATEGARRAAQASLVRAEEKAAQYEAAIRAARAEIFAEMEDLRARWKEQRAQELAAAREQVREQVARAKAELESEAERARQLLAAESDYLAEQISERILRGRAA